MIINFQSVRQMGLHNTCKASFRSMQIILRNHNLAFKGSFTLKGLQAKLIFTSTQ